MNKLQKAYNIWRQDGLKQLGKKLHLYLLHRAINFHQQIQYYYDGGIVKLDVSGNHIQLKCPRNKYRYLGKYEGSFQSFNEYPVLQDIIQESEPTDTFYDIGSNIGLYTCFVGNVSQEVVAFEPYEPNTNYTSENMQINDIDGRVYQKALSNTQGEVEMALPSKRAGESRPAIKSNWNESYDTVTVDMVNGDDFVSTEMIPLPDVIKIDVEGAELKVLEGLENTLQQACPIVYCETHPERLPDYEGSVQQIHEFFDGLGFETETVHQRTNPKFEEQYYIKAVKNEFS